MVPYDQFVAPGLLAAAAMNGAVFDTTFNFFFKYKYAHTFDAMLATPLGPIDIALGEMGWALSRGTIYAGAFLLFMAVLGLVSSPWGILCLPAAMLIGFAFAGAGMAATTFMRSFVDFDYVNIALLPLFLFSGTFFPLSQYNDRGPVARALHPALPRRGARAGAGVRRVQLGDARQRRVPRRHGAGRPEDRRPPPRPPPPALTRVTPVPHCVPAPPAFCEILRP